MDWYGIIGVYTTFFFACCVVTTVVVLELTDKWVEEPVQNRTGGSRHMHAFSAESNWLGLQCTKAADFSEFESAPSADCTSVLF